MNWGNIALWGFMATVILTVIMDTGRGIGLTRMDIPFMLGTVFTPDRDRAKWIGSFVHIIDGWIFALLYAAAFNSARIFTWWFGMAIGFVHALAVLGIGTRLLPHVHPRMATDARGPDPTRQLEPPGFFAINYGWSTPTTTIFAHLIYGGILGLFYRL